MAEDVIVSQTSRPKGHFVLECWEGASYASPNLGSLNAYQTQAWIFGDLCVLALQELS